MVEQTLSEMVTKCQDALDHLHQEYSKIQTGRANAALVENVMVESYGTKMLLKSMASVSIPEPKQIAIQPWDRGQLQSIEKAILEADIGLTPQNDGTFIRLNLPPMTEDRRKELVKLVHQYAEEARISVRNSRHEAINSLKALEKDKEISEDDLHIKEKEVQEKVDDFNQKIEEAAKRKEEDVMTV